MSRFKAVEIRGRQNSGSLRLGAVKIRGRRDSGPSRFGVVEIQGHRDSGSPSFGGGQELRSLRFGVDEIWGRRF